MLNLEAAAALNEGVEDSDIGTRNLHHMIAYLKFVLLEHPAWWKDSDFGYELFDMNIIELIYEKSVELEDEWVKAAWGA